MKNRFTNLSNESLLMAVAHINVDPCDPSQDAMHEALSELTRRYTRVLAVLRKMVAAQESTAHDITESDWIEARQSIGNVQFERCRDLEG